ncbi:hypothetical protein Hanom_Chr12g01162181 [Helianthus anomalus]
MDSCLFYCLRRNGSGRNGQTVPDETVRVETARVETRLGPKLNYFVGLFLQVVVVFLLMQEAVQYPVEHLEKFEKFGMLRGVNFSHVSNLT